MIDTKTLEETLKYCLFNDDEIVDGEPIVKPIKVEGIVANFGFHPNRVKDIEARVIEMLEQLPDDFKKSGGGGMSFLNMCKDKNGRQWTGLHKTMELLVCLGIAIGKVSYTLPREDWKLLPGGMPYIVIDL